MTTSAAVQETVQPTRKVNIPAVSPRLIVAVVAVVGLALLFNIQSDDVFLSSRNLSLLLRESALVAVLAAGVAIVMIMGEIDLSIGSAVYFAGILAAKSQVNWHFSPMGAVLLAVGFGVVLGLWHALWIVRVGVPSFIVTLTSLLGLRGLGLQFSGGKTIGPLPDSYIGLSEDFISISTTYGLILAAVAVLAWYYWRQRRVARTLEQDYSWPSVLVRIMVWAVPLFVATWSLSGFLGTPTAALWVAAIGILLSFLMDRTTFGRNAYLIGSNREAARVAGIGVGRHLLIAFVTMGVLYGLGGVLLTTRLGASAAGTGQFLELEAIAAAVIGGVSLRGGIGTVQAAIGGAFLLTIIDNGMQTINLSSFLQDVVKGGILLLAVTADASTRRPRNQRTPLLLGLRAKWIDIVRPTERI
ncbi:sugar ABC transporter permease [Nocardia sp. CDC160]|uniref:sugar ABC transporter permease n=1 Tax=Nocardia sp. CDC160 TaxID=3112166 RepID=UPI002DB6FD23|nr:hypothetical protein [Nocardia sp. CDC160]MEC3919210.1 hypothetical protein [Nocardia sp. CDC160]